ncbi:hypothetical protein PPTG_00344 [Phytophthora nicotianae INRA-310]|uniref:Uncharacterized protein n=3 Tax=Phytophthora nicotianae TaxID=4792 RepID=W2RH16_PHYN3|nr:hypothetical protein PPTG_00344 [Phytophthora nicotianae INRA-310]ETL50353.1 hypothetical protein L916_00389 [Phytophthora nicotianae]ETN23835.1 hypothetical protein PPTG_00344 [Phytophthora nicotianae INRA-310]
MLWMTKIMRSVDVMIWRYLPRSSRKAADLGLRRQIQDDRQVEEPDEGLREVDQDGSCINMLQMSKIVGIWGVWVPMRRDLARFCHRTVNPGRRHQIKDDRQLEYHDEGL